jgi:hypothetical protein
VAGQQVDRLGGVDRRAAADRDEPVPRALGAGVLGGLVHRVVGGLDVHAVEDLGVDLVAAQVVGDALRDADRADPGIGDDQHPLDAVLAELEADLVGGAGAELQRRRAPGEDRLFGEVHVRHV